MGSIISIFTRQTSEDETYSRANRVVREALQQNKVVIFSKSYCPFCKLAKDQFRKLAVEPYVIELDNYLDREEILNILAEMTGNRTVPRCFIDGRFIGGGTDVEKMYRDGRLKRFF